MEKAGVLLPMRLSADVRFAPCGEITPYRARLNPFPPHCWRQARTGRREGEDKGRQVPGCVPIVADNGGPRFAVSDDCGYRIPVGTAGQMSQAIADIIVEINRDRKTIAAKGQLASKRIATHFTEENYRRTVNEVYLAVTRQAKSGTGQLSRPLEAKLE